MLTIETNKTNQQVNALEDLPPLVNLTELTAKLTYCRRNKIQITAFHQIPMGDWDWPNEGHKTDKCITISCLKDVIDRLKVYLEAHPYQSVRLYVTPGGVRGFFLGKPLTVEEFFSNKEGGRTLDIDPLYQGLCERTNSFRVRTSPKLNRKNDWVAIHIGDFGAKPNQSMLNLLKKGHDARIKEALSKVKSNVKYVNATW